MTARAAVAAVLLAAAGCGGPSHPPPAADRAQVVVELEARAKEGVRGPKGDSGDSYSSAGRDPERARNYARVDYGDLPDIAVMLAGPGLPDGGPAPKAARLRIGPDGADHRLLLLGPRNSTVLTLENATGAALTLGCWGAGSDGFVATVPAGREAQATLSAPGSYELTCDERDDVRVTVIVAPTSWAALGRSNDSVVFDGLPPGDYELVVQAPRLPEVRRKVSAPAGKRTSVTVRPSVNEMESVK